MSSNEQSVFVVDSKGFSDKRVKIKTKKDHEGLTIGGNNIARKQNDMLTVGGEVISGYLTNAFISDIGTELGKKKRQDIGICKKPYLKYPRHKEENGGGKLLSRSDINAQYKGEIMKNLVKADAPLIRFIIQMLLSGEAYTYKQITDAVNKETGRHYTTANVNSEIWKLSKSKVSFLFKKVGLNPAVWTIDKRATSMEGKDLHELYKKNGSLKLEKAIIKYPFLADLIKEKGGPTIEPPTVNKSGKQKFETSAQTVDLSDWEPYQIESSSAEPKGMQALEKLAQVLTKNDGKIDLNVNINFKISFG